MLTLKVPPLLLAAALAIVMWLVQRGLPSLSVPVPGSGIVGAMLAAAGVASVLAGAYAFRRAGTTLDPTRPERSSAIVTTGIFAVSRNPMYLGFALALGGWAVWLSNLADFAFIPVFVFYMNRFQIAPEETAMREKFGETYAAYAASVRRWL